MIKHDPLASIFTEEQLRLASEIDKDVCCIVDAGAGDAALLGLLPKHMPKFKRLLDTTKPGDMEHLCERFDGFYRFGKVLESLAGGISSGAINVPK